MVHVKTTKGFEMDVDEAMFNDMELFESISEVEKGHMLYLPDVATKILGDRKSDLYDLLRNDSGRVPVDEVTNQTLEIIKQAGGKNS